MSNLETLAISISSLDCYAVVKKRCILLFSNANLGLDEVLIRFIFPIGVETNAKSAMARG